MKLLIRERRTPELDEYEPSEYYDRAGASSSGNNQGTV